jgi:hypothetical protein
MLPKSSTRSLVRLLSIAIAGGMLGNILHLTHGFGVEDCVRSKYLELQQWSRCWKKQESESAAANRIRAAMRIGAAVPQGAPRIP